MTGHRCCLPSAQRGDRVEPETAAFTSTAVRASTATMVRVEGGRFLMGSDDALSYPDDGEGPVREATLSVFRIDAVSRFVTHPGPRCCAAGRPGLSGSVRR